MGQATQPAPPAMTDAQYHAALIAVLGRIANALEAQAAGAEDQTITMPLGAFKGFDWASIGGRVLNSDDFGVAQVWHDGKVFTRRSNDKFGEDIWFSRGNGKNDDGTPRYAKLIEFRPVKPAEPLGRKTEQAMKAASQAPAAAASPPPPPPATQAPATQAPLLTSPLNAPPTTKVTPWDVALDTTELAAAIAEYQAMGKQVPPQYQLDAGDKPADVARKAKSLRELIEAAKRPAPSDEERQRFVQANREYADMLSAAIFHHVETPPDANLTNDETAGTIVAKIAILAPLVEAAKAKVAVEAAAAQEAAKTAAAKAAAERPLAPERLKELIIRKADGKPHNARCSPQNRAAIVATLEGIFGNDSDRHAVQQFLSGRASIKDAPENTLLAIFDWLAPRYDQDAKRFIPNPMAEREAHLVAQHVRAAAGQQSLPAGGK